ncbi:hypothetical protein HC031_15275 [Planosporangium thailandense]|uniref:O-antigen ligase n=1 Tax=Planosporangium thailandense TaxID=765197 RepID=A0ABX0XYU1_9ACTN|nr:O-antigen ligase family protein [Planosporangium thailandense]NJC71062.1 hypothetical protein [Planosporangium thailandense]
MRAVAARTPDGAVVTGASTTTPAHVAALLAALAAGVVAQGGYYAAGRILLTALVAVALVLALAARPPSRGDAGPLVHGCVALAAWSLTRAATAGGFPAAIGAVATLGCLAAAPLVLSRTSAVQRERCAEAVLGVGALVAIIAWAGVAWRLPRFAVLVEHRLWRGAATLTYPNAAAALLVPLALLAVALLAARPRSAPLAGGAYLLLVGVGAALSRAGLIALLAGFVVLTVGVGVRATVRAAAPPALGAVVAVGALAPSFPATAVAHPALAVAGLLVGAVVAIGAPRLPGRYRAATLTGALALVAAAAATQAHAGYLKAVLASRGNLDSSGRSGGARAALELAASHPLAGTGIGRSALFWTTPDGTGAVALYAHDEYLQILVDLGAVGLLLLAVLLAAVVVTIRRGRAHAHRPGIRAGAVAALAALAVHSGFDFLWHIAVLPLAAGLFIGLAAAATSEEPTPPGQKEK